MMSTLRRAKRGAANDSLNQGGPWWALVGLGPPPQPGEAYLSRRGRVLYHLGGNSGWSGNTLGTRLTGVSPRNAEQPMRRRRDVAGLHRLINATQGPSQTLCSLRGANCRAVQPFFHRLLLVCAACQTEIGACYRIAQLPKSPALPFSSELVGDKHTTPGTVLLKS